MNEKFKFLPDSLKSDGEKPQETALKADALCPCCKNRTIPNGGDALGYICPVCFWEIDLFISSDDEKSDQNHGLTLNEARENYKKFGAVSEKLLQYVRPAKDDEIVKENNKA